MGDKNMRKNILAIFAISLTFVSLGANAFEYRCMRGGMTKTEYVDACQIPTIVNRYGRGTVEDATEDLHYGYDYSGTPLEGKQNRISLFWTDDELLYSISISFSKGRDIIRNMALKRKILSEFSEAQETSDAIILTLIDEDVLEEAIRKKKIIL